jgi:hypothetical protein
MDKLAVVRKALRCNPEVIVVGEQEGRNEHFPHHTVNILVAPVVPMYTERQLESFMQSLLSLIALPATNIDHFWARWWDDKEYAQLDFGRLYFDEEVEPRLWRRIWVAPYPNIEIAESALNGVDEYSIRKSKFPPLPTPGVVVRFLNYLKSLA